MTNEQKAKYEDAAKEHASTILGIPANEILPDDTIINGFLAGATLAHNEAIDAALAVLQKHYDFHFMVGNIVILNGELEKLKL